MDDERGGRQPREMRRAMDAAGADAAADRGMRWIELLASEVGPRRPTGRGERLAAELMRQELVKAGVDAEIEQFHGYSSFAWPFGALLGLAIVPELLPARWRRARSTCAIAAALGVASEGSLRFTPLSRSLARRRSQNVVATVQPAAAVARTVCLIGHIDSSRSGLMFHPAVVAHLNRWISLQTVAAFAQAGEPIGNRAAACRAAISASRAVLALGLALLVERELRGADVPGANDNASGAAVAAQLAAEAAARPLGSTRLVLLLSGCEEAGTLGAQAFLRAHDTSGWMFLNFDSVGGAATLRYLRREGVIAKFRADDALVAIADRIAARRPELRLAPTDAPAGLTYDSSPVIAKGGRALSLSTQDGFIANLHRPTDTYENVDRDAIERTLEAGREMLAAIDRGEADGPQRR